MEKISKIKFIDINKTEVNYKNVKVNDLTVNNNHSYTIGDNNIIVHNCTTAYMTGFGSRGCMASTIQETAKKANVPIIADGGIQHPCDIAKSIMLGATMVMCGNLLTGCLDSPGKLIIKDNIKYKEYFGSASEKQSGKTSRVEGTTKLILLKNKTLLEQINFLKEALQSSISYGGGKDLISLTYVQYQ